MFDGEASVAVLPMPQSTDSDHWWRLLLSRDTKAPRIVARLPFGARGSERGAPAEAVFTANLAWAAEQAPGLRLTIEPLNPEDMPGYFLNDYDQAARILDDLDNPRIGLQFDLWHAARLHGDPSLVWADHRGRTNHVQIAGFPARNEPGGGGFSLPDLCDEVAALGNVWIAAEYRPARTTVQGLFWLNALKSRNTPIGD